MIKIFKTVPVMFLYCYIFRSNLTNNRKRSYSKTEQHTILDLDPYALDNNADFYTKFNRQLVILNFYVYLSSKDQITKTQKRIVSDEAPTVLITNNKHESTLKSDKDNRVRVATEKEHTSTSVLQTAHNNFNTNKNTNNNSNVLQLLENTSFKETPKLDIHINLSDEKVLFETATAFLKNLLYYRFNISRFFISFFTSISYSQVVDINQRLCMKNTKFYEFIVLSTQYARHAKPNIEADNQIIPDYVSNCEKWIIDEYTKKQDIKVLTKSIEYKTIVSYNYNYIRSLMQEIKQSGFAQLYRFLLPICTKKLIIAKYYYMLVSIIQPIYNVSLLIDKKLDKAVQKYLIDIGVFRVHGCCCAKEVQQHFVFHWAFCWIFHFSKYQSLPTQIVTAVELYDTIARYSKPFFVQVIIILHLVNSIGSEKITTKDFDTLKLYDLTCIIYELLYVNQTSYKECFVQRNMQRLLRNSFCIYSNKISTNNAVATTRIIRTQKVNIHFSNELIPEVQNFLTAIFDLEKEACRQLNLKN